MIRALRDLIIEAIDVAVDEGARLFMACEAINLCQRRLRRWRRSEEDGRNGGYRAVNQKFTELEKDAIVGALKQPEMTNLSLKVAHATLMDQGVYVGSPSTFARVVAERGLRKKSGNGKTRNAKRPELVATKPGQVWCWDITWLDAPHKGTYFYLYMIIDMYSRKVVGWDVFAKEDGTLARQLFAQALKDEGIEEGQLIVHADNGKPMRSKSLRGLFDLVNVIASYGRPHTSNDNAYAESLFATMKGRVSFPAYFGTLQSSWDFCSEFFTWYNCFHLHSGLDFMTPKMVHEGAHQEVFNNRNSMLEKDRIAHPSRHGGRQRKFGLPAEVRLKHRTEMTAVT